MRSQTICNAYGLRTHLITRLYKKYHIGGRSILNVAAGCSGKVCLGIYNGILVLAFL